MSSRATSLSRRWRVLARSLSSSSSAADWRPGLAQGLDVLVKAEEPAAPVAGFQQPVGKEDVLRRYRAVRIGG